MKIWIFSLLFSVPAMAATLNLNPGESAIIQANVNTKVTCSGSTSGTPESSCEERCQKYASYDQNTCAYEIKCEVVGNCLVETSCAKFASYDQNACVSETKKKTCH